MPMPLLSQANCYYAHTSTSGRVFGEEVPSLGVVLFPIGLDKRGVVLDGALEGAAGEGVVHEGLGHDSFR